jgi:short-subunit dehydrogenase
MRYDQSNASYSQWRFEMKNNATRPVAVVTGAAGAIGGEICRRLDKQGYIVVAVDLDQTRLEALDRTLSRPAVLMASDITQIETLEQIKTTIQTHFGHCNVLFNNAGIVVTQPFEEVSASTLRREQEVNLLAPLLLTNTLFPLLSASKGQVVTLCSLGGLLPLAECPGYSASKFGLRGLMLSLAQRTPETGVTISLINPTSVDTPMLRLEARNNGSPLNFLDEPLTAAQVAEQAVAQLKKRAVETDFPASAGWAIRLAMLMPNRFLSLLPMLKKRGEAGRQRYLQSLNDDYAGN